MRGVRQLFAALAQAARRIVAGVQCGVMGGIYWHACSDMRVLELCSYMGT